MSAHTPGPWSLMAGMPTNVLDAGGLRIARCDNGECDHPEAQANARLIAAAPALLEVVEALLLARESMGGALLCDENSPLIDAARTAIAQAKEFA